jgi:hypothetical protein
VGGCARFSARGCKSSAQRLTGSPGLDTDRARQLRVLTRTVLCAATHGLPAAARMSQGPSAATIEARAAAGSRSAAISTGMMRSLRLLRLVTFAARAQSAHEGGRRAACTRAERYQY